MEHDEIGRALLRRGQHKHTSSLMGRIVSIFRKSPEPSSLLQSSVSVGSEIVAKACIHLGREFRIAPDAALPSDFHLIVAFCFMVGALISASIEEEKAIDDIALQYGISRNLLIRRDRDEQDRIVNCAWGVAQDVLGLRDDTAHNWQATLTLGVNGYITGHDITGTIPGGYPELFGDLLGDLIVSLRESRWEAR